MKHQLKDDFDIYFVLFSKPVENSIINLVSPIFINEKDKLVGQYITNEKLTLFASIQECSTLYYSSHYNFCYNIGRFYFHSF